MAGRLSNERIQQFRNEGYIIFNEPVLPEAKFQGLKDHFEAKLATWTEKTGKSPENMDVPHFTDPRLFEWVMADEVLDLVESLIGPDIALWSTHFICKPPGVGKRVPWHEDSAYWHNAIDPMEVVTVWLAIDPSRIENGCMRVVPKTHLLEDSEYEAVKDGDASVFSNEIIGGDFESNAVDLILEPNQCSIHHAKMVHGSNPNTGDMRRCGFTMRYFPTTSKFHHDRHGGESFQIYLARGKDRAGNEYGDPSRPNEKWLAQHPEQRVLVTP